MPGIEESKRRRISLGESSHLERAARWAVGSIDGLGYAHLIRLLDATEDEVAQLFEMQEPDLKSILEEAGFSAKLVTRSLHQIMGIEPLAAYESELEALPAATDIVHLGERDYPGRMLNLKEPPVYLYIRGAHTWLPHLKTVAIVGSRKVGVEGVRLARRVARDLAEAGLVVVSGGALGVDAAAHRGCLDGGSPTISVLAGGVGRPTPRKNAPVFDDVVQHGALISEYPLGIRPRRFHFHRRNSLIAALGDATLVVRAGEKSGTMITARAARKLGRPLCALPGALDNPLAQGCHKLLVEGAQCVRGAADIVERVFSSTPSGDQMTLAAGSKTATRPRRKKPKNARRRPSAPPNLTDEARQVYDALREIGDEAGGGVAVDRLKRHLGWSTGDLSPALLELELAGAVSKRPGANVFEVT